MTLRLRLLVAARPHRYFSDHNIEPIICRKPDSNFEQCFARLTGLRCFLGVVVDIVADNKGRQRGRPELFE